MSVLVKRVALSVPVAVFLSLVLVSTTLAAHTWSVRIPMSSSTALGDGVVALNATTVLTVYEEWTSSTSNATLKVRRSTNSGARWGAPKMLSTDAYTAAIAALDPFVDVVWSEKGRVRYARSVDGGLTYAPSVALSPKGGSAANLSVARGAGNAVVIAWEDFDKGAASARVSTDGGVNFGAITNFASADADLGTTVAVGSGVIYLAYKSDFQDLQVVRSTSSGTTWGSPTTITTNGLGETFQQYLTASGATAYVAFVDRNAFKSGGTIRYRVTKNAGATWGSARQLSPAKWVVEYPRIELRDGVLRVAYGRQTSTAYSVYYEQTKDGVDWSTPEVVDPDALAPYVTYAGKIIVTVQTHGADYVRTGT